VKVHFLQLSMIVDKLYDVDLPESEVANRCQAIAELIEACGWTEDDYWREWLSQE
jgi:hypothetical protein